jgi:hypothetical protein
VLPAFVGAVTQPRVLRHVLELSDDSAAGGQALRAGMVGYLRAEREPGRLAAAADVEAAVTLLVRCLPRTGPAPPVRGHAGGAGTRGVRRRPGRTVLRASPRPRRQGGAG